MKGLIPAFLRSWLPKRFGQPFTKCTITLLGSGFAGLGVRFRVSCFSRGDGCADIHHRGISLYLSTTSPVAY